MTNQSTHTASTTDRAMYWQQLSLPRCPFEDNSGVLDMPGHANYYELIHHLILFNNLLLVLRGVKGVGKTTMLRQLPRKLGDDLVLGHLDAKTVGGIRDIISGIQDKFECMLERPFDNDTMHLNMLLNQIASRKKKCVLVIDDSHLLTSEVIEYLLLIVSSQQEEAYLHIVLCTDSGNDKHINFLHEQGAHWIHYIDVVALTLEQTKDYILAKMRSCGELSHFPLSPKQLTLIYKLSGGVIGRINQVTPEVLNQTNVPFNPLTMLARPLINRPKTVAASIVGLCAALVFGGYYQGEGHLPYSQSLPQPTLVSTSSPTEIKSQSDFTMPTEDLQRVVHLTPNKTTQIPEAHEQTHENLIANRTVQVKQNNETITTTANNQSYTPATQRVAQMDTDGSPELKDVITEPALNETMNHTEQPEKFDVEESARSNTSTDNGNSAQLKQVNNSQPKSKIPTQKLTENTSEAPVLVSKIAHPNYPKANLKAKDHYTIQLLASTNLEALKTFVKKHALNDKTKIISKRRQGKTWYALVYGDYAKLEEAKVAISNLAQSLQKHKPWATKINA